MDEQNKWTEEALATSCLRELENLDYDEVVVIETATGKCRVLTDGAFRDGGMDFDAGAAAYCAASVLPEDRERIRETLCFQNIVQNLEGRRELRRSFKVLENGRVRFKRARFTWLDSDRTYILGRRIDVTHIAKMEQERRDALESTLAVVEECNRSRGRFLSHLNKEIRSPMAAMGRLIEMEKDGDASAASGHCYREIMEALHSLEALFETIGDVSGLETGTIKLSKGLIDMTEMFNTLRRQVIDRAEKQGIGYRFLAEPSLKKQYIGDGERLHQILFNLLENGIKYARRGGEVILSARELRDEGDKATIQFEVCDTGQGITEQEMAHVFDVFGQGAYDERGGLGGPGMGNAVARGLARLMDGDISVHSEEDQTVFTVRVVLGNTAVPVAAGLSVVTVPPEETHPGGYNFVGKRVLVCEDHPLNAMIVKKILSDKGFEVIQAVNGKIGWEKYKGNPAGWFDAILMDIRMPVMDGLAATRRIRGEKLRDAGTIPIIAMTSVESEEGLPKTQEAGMNGYLTKPIDGEEMLQTLDGLISRKK